MNHRIVVFVAMAPLLVACNTMQRSPPPGDGKPGITNISCDGTADCWVAVTVLDPKAHTGQVNHPSVTIKRGKKVQIFWKVDTADCYFYSTAGDGVFHKTIAQVDGQFQDQEPVEEPKPNPKASPLKAQWYYWFSKNGLSKTYDYKVIFHCGTDETPYTVDPAIINEGP